MRNRGMAVLIYSIVLLSVFYTFMMLAARGLRSNYGKYEIFEFAISRLGNRIENPNGYMFFNWGMLLFALGLMPLLALIFSDMIQSLWVVISYGCFCLGCLGVISLTMFDENVAVHLFIAYFIFTMFGIGVISLFIHAFIIKFFSWTLIVTMSVLLVGLAVVIGFSIYLRNYCFTEWYAMAMLQTILLVGGVVVCHT
jgi:hypothetical protein